MRPIRSALLLLPLLASAAQATSPNNYTAAADYSASLGGRALLVLVDGHLAFERYDHGWSPDKPHPLASGTKSFTGPLAAAAIEDHIIPSWDARVSDDLPQWRADPLKRDITVRQLLSLSSGLDANDPSLETRTGGRALGEMAARRSTRIADTKVPEADDKFAAALATQMTGHPGQQFDYGPAHFYAFGAYLEARLRATHSPYKSIDDYFTARLAKPLDLHVAYWNHDAAGHPNLPGGALLTAREWAKFGQFILLHGATRNPDGSLKQILDPTLLAECFKPSKPNPQYGLTWWLPSDDTSPTQADTGGTARGANDRLANFRRRSLASQTHALLDPAGHPLPVYMAAGLGKQRLLILPTQNMVIVRFAEATPDNQLHYSDAKLLSLLLAPPTPPPPPRRTTDPPASNTSSEDSPLHDPPRLCTVASS